MSEHFICAPFLTELDCSSLKITVVLLKFAFEAGQQGKRITGCAGKACEDAIVVEAANLFGAGFHDCLTKRYLAIACKRYMRILSHQQDSRAAHSGSVFRHVFQRSTIGIRSNVSQGTAQVGCGFVKELTSVVPFAT
jgi:hypothetical protein